jgi:hypothetical protein
MFRTRRWLPDGSVARRSRGPLLGGVCLHWHTRRRAHHLDTRLAGGADPLQSDELSLRVGHLASARTRSRLASALRAAVELADMQYDPFRLPRPTVQRAEIRANRQLLGELADCLSAGGPLGVEGLAMASLLVNDRASPLHREAANHPLAVSAHNALVALGRGFRTAAGPT